MYVPDSFQETRLDVLHALIGAHPLGLMVSGGAGALQVDPVPFLIDPDRGRLGTLRAHVARANPHWQALAADGRACVVFQGPEAYVSPGWYAAKREHGKVVPTWNYAVVEVRGRAHIVEDADWLRRQIDDLTRLREAGLAEPWAVTDAPARFVAGMLRGIVGIELPIEALTGKWKVSQNRPEADRHGVSAGLGAGSAMARLVAERAGR